MPSPNDAHATVTATPFPSTPATSIDALPDLVAYVQQIVAAQLGNLARQHGLEPPALPAWAMADSLAKAQALQILMDRLTAFMKHVGGLIFTSPVELPAIRPASARTP
jgi:hypothetical protein